jgi:hypothetical protein
MPVVSRDPRGNTFKSEYQERIEAQDGTGDRRKSSAGTNPSLTNVDDSSEDTALFDLTESDIYNFNKVEPAINTIARVMNWMNLITCGIRFFAFAHAELPIIIRRAIEEAEEEEEVEDDEDAMEQEEEEPVLSLAQASFSVWLCACFIFTQNLHALFFVQNIGI